MTTLGYVFSGIGIAIVNVVSVPAWVTFSSERGRVQAYSIPTGGVHFSPTGPHLRAALPSSTGSVDLGQQPPARPVV